MNNPKNANPIQPNALVSLSERETLLRAQPAFSDLSVNDIAKLVGLMQEVHVETSEKLFTEGDIIDSVYILVSGICEVTHEVVVNNKPWITLLATLQDGDAIGLKGGDFFSQSGLRTATITASTPCLLLKMQLTELKKFIEDQPNFLESFKTKSAWMLRMQLVKQAALFIKLTPQQLSGLASSVKEIRVKSDQILFKEGDTSDSCYLICEGKVEVSYKVADGSEQVCTVLEPHSVFGEVDNFKFAKRNATARTITECTLLLMDKESLLELASNAKESHDSLLTLVQAHCRPCRYDNIIYQHRVTSDGQNLTVLKNQSTNNYMQLSEKGWFLWTEMDGNHTLAELSRLLYKQFGNSSADEVKAITQRLVEANFASIDINKFSTDGAQSSKSSQTLLKRLFHFTYFLRNPDKKIGFLYNHFGFVFFNIPSFIIQVFLIASGLVMFYKMLDSVVDNLKSIAYIPLWFLAVIVISMTLQLITPLIKAFAIKYFNYEVPRFGVMWQKIGPVGFVDTSDMWFSSSQKQAAVTLSGIVSNALIASLLSICAWYTNNSHTMVFFWLSALFMYLQTLRSLNPMLDLDGYDLICFAFNCPQLRKISIDLVLHKNKQSEHFWHGLFFWIYSLGYLFLISSFTVLILNGLLLHQNGYPYFRSLIIASLIILFFIEIILAIKNNKQTNLSQIV